MNDSLTRRIWDVDQFVLNPLDAMLLPEPVYCISCTNEVTFSRTAFEVVFFKDGTIFKGPENSLWICMNCGYVHEGPEAPLVCPLCKYPRAYYKPYCKVTNA